MRFPLDRVRLGPVRWLARLVVAACTPGLIAFVHGDHADSGVTDALTSTHPPSIVTQVGRPTFTTGVALVALDVCVKSRDGGFVRSLQPGDFLVLEDRIPQTLEFFEADGRLPLSVVLLVDASTSMAGSKLARAKQAATAFLDRLGDADLVEVLAFNQIVDRRLALSTDRAAAASAIAELRAGGQTGLWEALVVALRDLQRAEPHGDERRQVILVLSDGEDTSSRLAFEDVLDEIRRSGVLVYGISLSADDDPHARPPSSDLARLAHDTGGRGIVVRDPATLTPVYEEIAVELRNLYRLGYIPSATTADGAWRRIAIQLRDRSLHVRTRAGYYASRR